MATTSLDLRTTQVVLHRTQPGRYTAQHAGHTWHVLRAQTGGDEQYVVDRDDVPAYAQVGTLREARATIETAQPSGVASLTPAERRCLGNILALGGAWSTGNGRDCRGAVRKNIAHRLHDRGLVELGPRKTLAQAAADRGWPAPRRRPDLEGATWYATAAGCAAYGPEVARVS